MQVAKKHDIRSFQYIQALQKGHRRRRVSVVALQWVLTIVSAAWRKDGRSHQPIQTRKRRELSVVSSSARWSWWLCWVHVCIFVIALITVTRAARRDRGRASAGKKALIRFNLFISKGCRGRRLPRHGLFRRWRRWRRSHHWCMLASWWRWWRIHCMGWRCWWRWSLLLVHVRRWWMTRVLNGITRSPRCWMPRGRGCIIRRMRRIGTMMMISHSRWRMMRMVRMMMPSRWGWSVSTRSHSM